ncbi:hypothetical protein E2C01_101122 [Portunus trituberculatus]|uniref:Uncharacterized protein n=1 Tax=Portunus trituberculatus TaxID=210409 RepID=A0A5B7K4W2_PORTR|nr:hypothetical protein [Portunus trituberculatus]
MASVLIFVSLSFESVLGVIPYPGTQRHRDTQLSTLRLPRFSNYPFKRKQKSPRAEVKDGIT